MASEKNEWGLKGYKAHHTETHVDFTLDLSSDSPLLKEPLASLPRCISLESSFSTGNMHLFDAQGNMKK